MKFVDTEPNTAKKGDLYFNTQLNTYFAYDRTSCKVFLFVLKRGRFSPSF
ncbi:hypothetical protein MSHRCOH1_06520 [Candidatus Ornithobacterium hominis]|nr:hypothetical protein MSHRCOH1_06520 [Candidatus Ornithobacterium hominis]